MVDPTKEIGNSSDHNIAASYCDKRYDDIYSKEALANKENKGGRL
jgi:hypothetical protein